MRTVNLALLSALYNSQSNLYNSIYLPIIKYSIVTKLEASENNKQYGKVADIKECIEKDFGLYIPEQVIQQSLTVLSKANNGFRIYPHKDGSFRIDDTGSYDATFIAEIGGNSKLLTQRLQELETRYEIFLEANKLDKEKSFSDFFRVYTSEVLSYLKEQPDIEVSCIDESFAKNARFLTLLRDNKDPLYDTASIVLWGNIVAAFLQRDKADIHTKPSPVSYYLDTSLVLGCLDLGTELDRGYSQDLIKVIKDSGSQAIVHGATIEEIDQILYSVEHAGSPRPYTAISEAWSRLKLSSVKLISIRDRLVDLIKEQGLSIQDPDLDINKIRREYQNKPDVRTLESNQQGASEWRYIHDVYMRDYIRRLQNGVISKEKVKAYFVTSNRDMQRLFRSKDNSISYFLSPNEVILDLWLHGYSSFEPIRDAIMSENLSRCFLLNERSAKQRIKIVTEHYNPSDENFDIRLYKRIEEGILSRSKKILRSVDELSGDDLRDEDQKKILNQLIEASKELSLKQEVETKEKLAEKDQEIKYLREQNTLEKQIAQLRSAISDLKSDRDEWCKSGLYRWWIIEIVLVIIIATLLYTWNPFYNIVLQWCQKNAFEVSHLPRWIISIIIPIIGVWLNRRYGYLYDYSLYKQRHKEQWEKRNPALKEKEELLAQIEERLSKPLI